MAESRKSRGVPVPDLWQVLVSAAVVCALWLLWSLAYEPSASRDIVPRGSNFAERLQLIETLVDQGDAAVPEFLVLLSNADPKKQCDALFGLARLGPEARAALDAVREKLAGDNPRVRDYALSAFTRICGKNDETVATAIRLLADADSGVRETAASAIEVAGPAGVDGLTALASAELPATRSLAIRLLRRFDPRLDVGDALRGFLADSDAGVHAEAVGAVVERGIVTSGDVRTWLREDDPRVVQSAISVLWRHGPDHTTPNDPGLSAAEVLPEIRELLEKRANPHAPSLLSVLKRLKTTARPLVPALEQHVETWNGWQRIEGAETLCDMGADPADVVRIVRPLLLDKELYICRSSAYVLARASPEEARCEIQQLITTIERDPNADDRSALSALCGMGEHAQEAIPLLTRLVGSSNEFVAGIAVETLGRIGPDAGPAVFALLALLESGAFGDRHCKVILAALGQIRSGAHAAVPTLLAMLAQSDRISPRARPDNARGSHEAEVISALGNIGDDSPEVLAALRRRLTSSGPRGEPYREQNFALVSLQALLLLSAKSPAESQRTLQDLVRLLGEGPMPIRIQAALGIAHLAVDRRAAVGPLIRALGDQDIHLKTSVVTALGQIGPPASAAATSLRALLRDPENERPNASRDIGTSYQFMFGPQEALLKPLSVAAVARSALAAIEGSEPKTFEK